MITFGRKFLGCTVATVLLAAIYFVTLFFNKEAINSLAMITYAVLIVTIWFGYIGGNIWSKWVTSKYLKNRSELVEDKEA
jgi:hypothetical protein